MTVTSLMPVPWQQFCDANGKPLAGGTLTFYSPGTTTLKTVYTSSGGLTAASNPLTLDSAGRASVWLSGYYDVLLKDSAGVTVWTGLNISSLSTITITLTEWILQTDVLTYVGATQFSMPGDVTDTYQVGRRIQAVVAAGTIYGTVTVSAYTTVTTITVAWDTGVLDAGLSAVSVGILAAQNPSIPTPPFCVYASLPAAGQSGRIYRVTDKAKGGVLYMDTGTIWVPMGDIAGISKEWSGSIANIPAGYLLEDGTSVLRASYPELFTALSNGVIYGVADGTHFNLPDSRDKTVVGATSDDSGVPKTNITGSLTASGGSANHTHTGPSHTHTFTTGNPDRTVTVAGGGNGAADSVHSHAGTTAANGIGNTGNNSVVAMPYGAKVKIIRY